MEEIGAAAAYFNTTKQIALCSPFSPLGVSVFVCLRCCSEWLAANTIFFFPSKDAGDLRVISLKRDPTKSFICSIYLIRSCHFLMILIM